MQLNIYARFPIQVGRQVVMCIPDARAADQEIVGFLTDGLNTTSNPRSGTATSIMDPKVSCWFNPSAKINHSVVDSGLAGSRFVTSRALVCIKRNNYLMIAFYWMMSRTYRNRFRLIPKAQYHTG
jgi:hypothetical protein